MKRVASICLMVAVMSIQASAVIIGDWETGLDGWIDWSGAATSMVAGQTVGVTSGSGSLLVEQSGWGQSLSIKLQDVDLIDEFMSNSIFSIDVSVAANDGTIEGGYSQIYSVAMNADGPGWTSVASGTPVNFYWWAGSSARTETLDIDYTDFKEAITGTNYIEIILTLNTGGGAPAEMYFDNAQLTPEPTTLFLLGFGAFAAMRRRK